MLTGNNYHLTYCANVHPGETWEETFLQLKKHLPEVKRAVSPGKNFGTGLYLSDLVSREILTRNNLPEFKSWLEAEGLYVFTMNGFPYGGFHGKVVKDAVYKPDWTSRERVEYTKRLFAILAGLLPDGMDGGVSTSPVSYKYWFSNTIEVEGVFEISCRHFIEIAFFLQELESKTGKLFHLDIEPEPDCFLENSVDAIEFFTKKLIPSAQEKEAVIRKHIRLCFDICHFAVEYEEPETALTQLISNGIKIGKIQISSALKADLNNNGKEKMRALRKFDEPRYLHQTIKRTASGAVKRFRDLPMALSDQSAAAELRTHFHVPLFLNDYGGLHSTQDDVLKVIKFLKEHHVTNHLEVETYTWDVLPADLKTDLTNSIIRELLWVKNNLEG